MSLNPSDHAKEMFVPLCDAIPRKVVDEAFKQGTCHHWEERENGDQLKS